MTQQVIQITQNYDGKRYLSWLNGDYLNAQNTLNTLFRGGFTNDSTDFTDLLKASKQIILDLEEDVTKLKEVIDNYSIYEDKDQ